MGQVGDGSSTDRLTPIQIGTDLDWLTISTGEFHNLAIKTNGTLWTWGYNNRGQLGIGSTQLSYVPVQVGTDTDWQAVAAGDLHSIAIKSNGTLWRWGQIVGGGAGDLLTPQQYGTDTNWQACEAGLNFGIGLKTNGTIWSWGANNNGALGLGMVGGAVVPTQIGTGSNWQIISASNDHAGAVQQDNSCYLWGGNEYGQAGNGANEIQLLLPSEVSCNTLSINEMENYSALKIYPNPVANVLNIVAKDDSTIQKVSIFDMAGKKIIEQSGINLKQINTTSLNQGLYFLEVIFDNSVQYGKFLKQ